MSTKSNARMLENLRHMMLPQRKSLEASKLSTGIPLGAITSISGFGKTSFVVEFISEHSNHKVAWIEKKISIYPFAFLQKKIKLDRILFIECGKESEWVCLQILKSQIFRIIVIYTDFFSLQSLRRLQLASEKSDASLIWLSPKPQMHWPIHLEIGMNLNSDSTISILRQRSL